MAMPLCAFVVATLFVTSVLDDSSPAILHLERTFHPLNHSMDIAMLWAHDLLGRHSRLQHSAVPGGVANFSLQGNSKVGMG
ncbi:hypothetical protein CDL15_Pgr002025 [Punica granatum]|nr:hypothetical protein CDL15_Pgr002025 [Punica granatum]